MVFFFFYKNEMRDKQMKKQTHFKLNANTEGISMTNISGHPLKGPTKGCSNDHIITKIRRAFDVCYDIRAVY